MIRACVRRRLYTTAGTTVLARLCRRRSGRVVWTDETVCGVGALKRAAAVLLLFVLFSVFIITCFIFTSPRCPVPSRPVVVGAHERGARGHFNPAATALATSTLRPSPARPTHLPHWSKNAFRVPLRQTSRQFARALPSPDGHHRRPPSTPSRRLYYTARGALREHRRRSSDSTWTTTPPPKGYTTRASYFATTRRLILFIHTAAVAFDGTRRAHKHETPKTHMQYTLWRMNSRADSCVD